MAFGFFKKTQTADVIFYNGQVYTHDPDYLWAEAVACANGVITAVGEYEGMSSLIGKNTRLVDLSGKYMLPGFIDVHRSPVMKVFEGRYLNLTGCRSTGEVLNAVKGWAKKHRDGEIIFGYGMRDDLEPEQTDIDRICSDRPVVILASSCVGCAVNTAAEQIIHETAEEECVEVITVGYVLNLLVPFDFEEVEAAVSRTMEGLSRQGITSVLNLQTPDYFEGLYQDSMIALYNEDQLKQRFFGSYLMTRPLQPRGLNYTLQRRQTNCTEMGDMVRADMLHLLLDQSNCPMPFPQEALNEILPEVCDKGFDIFLEAVSREDLLKAYNALDTVRGKGYKNTITIASQEMLTEEDLKNLENAEDVLETWGSDWKAAHPLTGTDAETAEEAINQLTLYAASMAGMEGRLGCIEKGYLADFAVFKENPLDMPVSSIEKLQAEMTVLAGEIVFSR